MRREQSRSRAVATQDESSGPMMTLPVGLHGFESRSAPRPRPGDLAPELGQREIVSPLRVEQDGNRREAPEDVEQLLVRGVVREEVAEVHLARSRRRRA